MTAACGRRMLIVICCCCDTRYASYILKIDIYRVRTAVCSRDDSDEYSSRRATESDETRAPFARGPRVRTHQRGLISAARLDQPGSQPSESPPAVPAGRYGSGRVTDPPIKTSATTMTTKAHTSRACERRAPTRAPHDAAAASPAGCTRQMTVGARHARHVAATHASPIARCAPRSWTSPGWSRVRGCTAAS